MAKMILNPKKSDNEKRVEKAAENIAVNTVEMISTLMEELNKELKKSQVPEEILEKEISEFGNSSHIILPKEYAKKKAIVIIRK